MTFDLAVEAMARNIPGTWRVEPFRRHATLVDEMNSKRSLPLLSLASTGIIAPRKEDGGMGRQAPSESTIERYWVAHPGNLVVNPMWLIGGGIGVSAVTGAVSPDYRVYRLGPDLHPQYVHHLLRSAPYRDQYRLYTRADTTFDRRVSKENFHPMPLLVPPLEEQRRIADFLDAETARIDHLTAKLHRQSELITEREETSIPMGVAGALLHTAKVRTGLPWMPFMNPDAQVVPLLRVLQLQRGVDLSDDQRIDGSVPVVTTAGHSGWHNRAIAEGPGVVIRRYGSRGNVHWVDSDYWPHNTTLYVKNFNGNSRRYCYHLLRALPYEMEQVKAAIPGVNRNDLHRLKVAIVPQALQESVAEAMDSDMAKFQAARERIQRLRQLLAERRQALITAAVTGQFDVSTASGRNVTDGVSA